MLQCSEEASFPSLIERNAHMHKSDLWISYGEAMQMSLEGNRMIAHELAKAVSGLWKKATHFLESLLHGHGRHQHLPPR